jgi:acetoin utilization deacetylase AcuC-like enzyme
MTIALFTHEACLGHDPGPGHPECIDRLTAITRALAAPEITAVLPFRSITFPRFAWAEYRPARHDRKMQSLHSMVNLVHH